jgi:hypothetical protein
MAWFDRFMERTLPLWFMLSSLLALLAAYWMCKAAFRIRHLRALLDDAARKAGEEGAAGPGHPRQLTPSRDWVASGPARER